MMRSLLIGCAGCVLLILTWLARLPGASEPLPPAPVLAAVVVTAPPAESVVASVPAPAATLKTSTVQADPDWVRRASAASGIFEAAVSAYARAVLTSPNGCRLGWTTLAGIGWVESQQGTIDGRSLGADGRPSTPIIGPALDGVGPVAAIGSSTQGRALHGDPLWDHAVGPLQFLPSTWATWGRDGDGDGLLEPQDIDDAATAAAAYLCGTGYDLGTDAGWAAGVHAYNHSDAYVASVNAAATTYADRTADQ